MNFNNKQHESFYTQLTKIDFTTDDFTSEKAAKCINLIVNNTSIYFNAPDEIDLDFSENNQLIEGILNNLLCQEFDTITDFLNVFEQNCLINIASERDILLSLIAGRLGVLKIYFSVSGKRKFNPYDHEAKSHYLLNALKTNEYAINYSVFDELELKTFVAECSTNGCLSDFMFDYSAMKHWLRTYLPRNSSMEITEYIHEVFMLSALNLASVEQKDSLSLAKIFYNLLSQKKISLSSPLLINFRKKEKRNLSSCFIVKAKATSMSIGYLLLSAILISRQNGGLGIYLGHMDNLLVCTKVLNDLSVAFSQDENSKRQSAFTVATEVWHYDIMKFLDIQLEVGDQRFGRCYDIFPQLVIPDEFMFRVVRGDKWYLFKPSEVKEKLGISLDKLYGDEFSQVYNDIIRKILSKQIDIKYRVVDALHVITVVMQRLVETGLPYLFFKCTVNKLNPNKSLGMIPCGNLCQESFSNIEEIDVNQDENMNILESSGAAHTCNLCSLNLSNLLTLEDVKYAARYAVKLLDNSIDLTQTPIKASLTHNLKYRTIGVGVMGLHDYLAYHKVEYEHSNMQVNELFRTIALAALDSSADIAAQKGPVESFYSSELHKGVFNGMKVSDLGYESTEVVEKIMQHGLRNTQLIAVAPTSSTSLMMNASASILPVFQKFMVDSNNKGYNIVIPRFSYSRSYVSYSDMNIKKVISVVSEIAKFVDQGISFEMLFDINNRSTDAKLILNSIISCWDSNFKTLYYTRFIQRKNIFSERLSTEKNECESCAL